MEEKRKISLGFIEIPEEHFKEDTIYVNFNLSNHSGQITAKAKSKKEFTYHSTSIGGFPLINKKKEASTYTGSITTSWHKDYNIFLHDLIENNNGELDYERLIIDGSKISFELYGLSKTLEKIAKEIEIKPCHDPWD